MKDWTSARTELRPGHRPPAHCSFCGKGQDRVKLVAGPSLEPGGPGVFICNECVELCREILAESEPPPAGSA